MKILMPVLGGTQSLEEVARLMKKALESEHHEVVRADLLKPHADLRAAGIKHYDMVICVYVFIPPFVMAAERRSSRIYGDTHLQYVTCEGEQPRNIQLRIIGSRLRFIGVSKFVCERIQEFGLPTIGHIPHGVDLDIYNVAQEKIEQLRNKFPGKKIIYMLGSSVVRKGLFHIPAILNRLKQTCKEDFVFWLTTENTAFQHTGNEATTAAFEKFASYKDVLFHEPAFGKLSKAEIAARYAMCDFYIQTSESEGFCLPLLESMAAGKAAVCVDAAPMNELVSEKTGFLVPSHRLDKEDHGYGHTFFMNKYDPKLFADQIRYALENEDVTKTRARNAVTKAQEYDYMEVYKRFLTFHN